MTVLRVGHPWMRHVATAVAVACAVGVCGSSVGSSRALDGLAALPQAEPTTSSDGAASTTTSPARRDCEARHLATASYRPEGERPAPGSMPAGTFMAEIQARGRLIVGVDQNTLGFGYRNRDGEITGFDVALLHEVARAIFGDPDAIELRAVTSAERVPAVKNGEVDIVASVMTMTCARWEDVAFSSEYFHGVQKVLVRNDSDIEAATDLDGRKVCATRGSTSIENLQKVAPGAEPYPVATRTECLIELQEGRVDAISTDDTILYGFHHQDPKTRLLDVQLEDEPYGMAISQDHPELVRFVNALLEDLRADGTWSRLHQALEADLGLPPAVPPTPVYRD